MMQNYTYMLECADGSFYTGWTNHLCQRLIAHQNGTGGKYTRAKRPVKLIYFETFSTKQEAMSREWAIKHLTRKEKEKLLQGSIEEERQNYIKYCNQQAQWKEESEYNPV